MTYRGRILAIAAVLGLLALIPTHASAATTVPFQAIFRNSFTASAPCSPGSAIICVPLKGSGYATHLGWTQDPGVAMVNTASSAGPGCVHDAGSFTLTAANGDQITLVTSGKNCSTGPTTGISYESYQVTGGTGRFAGATGSGTSMVYINFATSTSVATYDGDLSSPGSLK